MEGRFYRLHEPAALHTCVSHLARISSRASPAALIAGLPVTCHTPVRGWP